MYSFSLPWLCVSVCVCVYYMCVIICKVSAVRDMRRLPPPTSQQTTDRDARLILQARFPLKILLLEKGPIFEMYIYIFFFFLKKN